MSRYKKADIRRVEEKERMKKATLERLAARLEVQKAHIRQIEEKERRKKATLARLAARFEAAKKGEVLKEYVKILTPGVPKKYKGILTPKDFAIRGQLLIELAKKRRMDKTAMADYMTLKYGAPAKIKEIIEEYTKKEEYKKKFQF